MLLLVLPWCAQAQWSQQSIALRPGWNAVYLEVHPQPEDCDTLFAGLSVESVWDFNRSADSPQFIQDPVTLIPGAPGWLTWFPPGSPLAGRGSLFTLRDGRPYLVKLADNAQPATWTVTGKPSLRRATWQAGVVNFTGFHVGTQAPSFQSLFAGETGLAGQPVYSLDPTGVWRPIVDLATAKPKPGESYWIRCRAPSVRSGTIEVDPGSRLGLSFSGGGAEQSLRVRNTSSGARTITVLLLPSEEPPQGQPPLAGPVPLEYWRSDFAAARFGWEPLPEPLSFKALQPGQEWNIRLGARLLSAGVATPGSQFQSLLEVRDDLGTRWVIPITTATAFGAPIAARARLSQAQTVAAHAGLWVGEAVFKAVSNPSHPSNPSLPRPAGGDFSFRLILHVDAGGTTRLLRQVYIVRKPPTSTPDPANPGFNHIDEPARSVLVTDEALIPAIIGTGEILGRRMSTAAFSFRKPLALAGGQFGAGTLAGTVTLDYDDPLNPFKHLYHPDHNNLDERFERKLPEGKEAFTVTRSISLEFNNADPLGLNPPGWGDSELGGVYRETISGLHRSAIRVSGVFRVVRVLSAATLDQ